MRSDATTLASRGAIASLSSGSTGPKESETDPSGASVAPATPSPAFLAAAMALSRRGGLRWRFGLSASPSVQLLARSS